jgi:hypothetical protein
MDMELLFRIPHLILYQDVFLKGYTVNDWGYSFENPDFFDEIGK